MNNKTNYKINIRIMQVVSMNKMTRNQRIMAITKMLLESPNKVISLNIFSEAFNAAKSTISEDIVIVRETLMRLSLGRIETVSGAAGGVKYICGISKEDRLKFAEDLCSVLRDESRIVPGNFIYMTDIMCNPVIIQKAAVILAQSFVLKNINCVVTVETKGIPLAYEVAKLLGVQLVVVKRENKVTEGSTVNVNYVSGSSGRIQTMFLSKKALKKGSKCVFIDDFMKAGGTAFGIIDLLGEFESELVGIGVLVDNVEIQKKMVDNYISIIKFKGIDDEQNVMVSPTEF